MPMQTVFVVSYTQVCIDMGYALDYDPTPNKVALKKFGLAVCKKQNPRQRKPAKECAIFNQVFSVIDFAQTSPNFSKAPSLS